MLRRFDYLMSVGAHLGFNLLSSPLLEIFLRKEENFINN